MAIGRNPSKSWVVINPGLTTLFLSDFQWHLEPETLATLLTELCMSTTSPMGGNQGFRQTLYVTLKPHSHTYSQFVHYYLVVPKGHAHIQVDPHMKGFCFLQVSDLHWMSLTQVFRVQGLGFRFTLDLPQRWHPWPTTDENKEVSSLWTEPVQKRKPKSSYFGKGSIFMLLCWGVPNVPKILLIDQSNSSFWGIYYK